MGWGKKWLVLLAWTVACGGTPSNDTETYAAQLDSELLRTRPLKRVTLETGVELAYLEQGYRRGDPVIFLHGYTDSHHSFDLNLPILPWHYHAFVLDQRGHGVSEKPGCCYTQADFAEDVVAFMDAMGLKKATLVGHSMGSFIAHKVAVDFPDRVEKLVLIGSAATVAGNPVGLELEAAVDELTDPIDPEFVRAFQASTFYRPIPASYLDTAVRESLRVPATVWRQALDNLIAEDHSAALSGITAPTLLLHGDKDAFFSAEDQRRLDSLIPDATSIVYQDVGHGMHAEVPKRVVRDIVRFLR